MTDDEYLALIDRMTELKNIRDFIDEELKEVIKKIGAENERRSQEQKNGNHLSGRGID